jgi:hypothetical protein
MWDGVAQVWRLSDARQMMKKWGEIFDECVYFVGQSTIGALGKNLADFWIYNKDLITEPMSRMWLGLTKSKEAPP